MHCLPCIGAHLHKVVTHAYSWGDKGHNQDCFFFCVWREEKTCSVIISLCILHTAVLTVSITIVETASKSSLSFCAVSTFFQEGKTFL